MINLDDLRRIVRNAEECLLLPIQVMIILIIRVTLPVVATKAFQMRIATM